MDQPGDEGDDALIWADVPSKLCERLASKPQQITESYLLENVKHLIGKPYMILEVNHM